jgi:UDP-3-O-[3-hydroxymyristoyl] glucosamine N-acyltransferase
MEGAEVTCSYLWDNVVVQAGARVHDGCLLATGVEVGAAAVIGKGAVLSFGVKIAPKHTVRPFPFIPHQTAVYFFTGS